MVNLSRWISSGRAREIETESHRDGRQWRSRAIVVSADVLVQAIDDLGDADWNEAANDWAGS